MTKKIDWKAKYKEANDGRVFYEEKYSECVHHLRASEHRCEDLKKHVKASGEYIAKLEQKCGAINQSPDDHSKDESIRLLRYDIECMKRDHRGLLRAHIIAKSEAEKAKSILSIIAGKDPEKNIASFALEEMTRARRAMMATKLNRPATPEQP